jgi:hypothetical protein
LLTLTFKPSGFAQIAHHAPEDTILLGARIMGTDTIPFAYLNEVIIRSQLPANFAARQEELKRLRRNVERTYPYAILAAQILNDVNARTQDMQKRDRKKYLKIVEAEMTKRFKGELQNLSINQGQILVKLISRETGRDCYSIIKEVKGGLNAVMWQSMGLLFSNNLKRDYDPQDRDRDIEMIVQDIEVRNYYQWKANQQASR